MNSILLIFLIYESDIATAGTLLASFVMTQFGLFVWSLVIEHLFALFHLLSMLFYFKLFTFTKMFHDYIVHFCAKGWTRSIQPHGPNPTYFDVFFQASVYEPY